MTQAKGAGRPGKQAQSLSKAQILTMALPLIRAGGVEAVSFRRLAEQLGVSAMAVKYHVGDQQKMLADLIDIAFRDTLVPAGGEAPADRLRHVLTLYCTRALENANLIRCMLNDPSLMSADIIQITKEIRRNTQILNDGDTGDEMLNLLVDYTHGFIFSAVAAPPDQRLTLDDFLRSLNWILRLATPDNS